MHYDKLHPGGIYHVYNHAVGEESLFRSEDNFKYFLLLYDKYITPVADLFAFCLMPNHFHLLLRIKNKLDLIKSAESPIQDFDKFIVQQFSNFFNAYTKAYNKVYQRRGRLFTYPFRRRRIADKEDFMAVAAYIHNNPVHHGFVEKPEDWKFSSYESYYDNRPSKLIREMVEQLFGDKFFYTNYHKSFDSDRYAIQVRYSY